MVVCRMCIEIRIETLCNHVAFSQAPIVMCKGKNLNTAAYCESKVEVTSTSNLYCSGCIQNHINTLATTIQRLETTILHTLADLRPPIEAQLRNFKESKKGWDDMVKYCKYVALTWMCGHKLWEGKVIQCVGGAFCACSTASPDGIKNTESITANCTCGCNDIYMTPGSSFG
jgi:hypothetical protein